MLGGQTKLFHQITNGRSIIRPLGPASAEKLPHFVIQPTLDDTVVCGAVGQFTPSLFENQLVMLQFNI